MLPRSLTSFFAESQSKAAEEPRWVGVTGLLGMRLFSSGEEAAAAATAVV